MNSETSYTPQQHWFGMPEFEQTKQRPYAQIILRVDNADHLAELSKRLGQPLTRKTKSAWFPFWEMAPSC